MLSSLCFPRTIGGVENHIYYLVKALKDIGHYVEIVVPVVEENNDKLEITSSMDIDKIVYDGITVYEVYVRGLPLYTSQLRNKFSGSSALGMALAFINKASYQSQHKRLSNIVGNIMSQCDFDLLHQHDFSASILTSKHISKKYPVVLTNHTGEYLYLNKNLFTRKTLKYMLSHYTSIIGPSKELTNIPYYTDKAHYIPNGVQTDEFMPLDKDVRSTVKKDLGFSENDFIVLCPRRWAPTKGVLFLADAIMKLGEDAPNMKFLFAGSDYSGYPAYKNEILDKLHGVKQERYYLLGDLDANTLKNYYQVSDLVVIPSLMEATSLAALEAMASKCPVLATNVGGMPEIILHNKTGFLIDCADGNLICKELLKIHNMDVSQRGLIAENARKMVIENYDWSSIAKKTIDVYNEALQVFSKKAL